MSTALARLLESWGIETISEPRESRIFEARTRAGTAVILKLPALHARPGAEVAALHAWGGHGAPLVLAHDESSGALLLEHVRPAASKPTPSAAVVAALLAVLAIPAPSGLPLLEDVVHQQLDAVEQRGDVSAPRLAWARAAFERLHDVTGQPGLVHGSLDSHHLLCCAEQGVRAIGPRPSSGDTTYDAACWIHAGGAPGRRARFDALAAELDTDRGRLRDWCGVVAVCAAAADETL